MNYKNLGVSLGVALLAVLIYLAVQGNSSDKTQPTDAIIATTTAPRLTATPLALDVTLTLPEVEQTTITDPTAIEYGSVLETSPSGRALVGNDAGDILTSLDANSTLRIESPEPAKGTAFTLTAGRLWAQVKRVLELDETYTVYTPTLVAAVRGTSFGVDLLTIPRLVVTEGIVFVWQRDEETGEIVLGTEVQVPAGTVIEEIDGRLATRTITSRDQDDWYREFNEVESPRESENQRDMPVTPVTAPVVSSPITPPPTEPVPPNPTPVPTTPTTITSPAPVTPKLSFSRVQPQTLTDPEEDRVRIYGAGFSALTDVFLNARAVEFRVMSDDFLIINTSELGGNGGYDLRLVSRGDEVRVANAFTINIAAPLPSLSISNVILVSNDNFYTRITGVGLAAVDQVQVNGQSVAEFEIVSDTEIHAFANLSFVENAQVFTANGSASWPN